MKILWAQRAYDSLADILDYSEGSFGHKQAERIEERILTAIERLRVFPASCAVIPEISNDLTKYRKLVISHEISVIYRAEEDAIRIDFIWDIRRSLHQIYYIIKTS